MFNFSSDPKYESVGWKQLNELNKGIEGKDYSVYNKL